MHFVMICLDIPNYILESLEYNISCDSFNPSINFVKLQQNALQDLFT